MYCISCFKFEKYFFNSLIRITNILLVILIISIPTSSHCSFPIIKAEEFIETPTSQRINAQFDNERLILSLDGGGIRGILEAYILNELELSVQKHMNECFQNAPFADIRIGECFDLVTGTSTGGLIALSMRVIDPNSGRPKFKMSEILEFYRQQGKTIFTPNDISGCGISNSLGLCKPRYAISPLLALLENYVGDNTLASLKQPTIITTVTNEGLHLFKSFEAIDPNKNYKLVDTAHATVAAPTFFTAAKITNVNRSRTQVCVDGGLTANNPSKQSYINAKQIFPGSRLHHISLGTGELEEDYNLAANIDGGILNWLTEITPKIMRDAARESETFTSEMARLDGNTHTRLQFKLKQAHIKMDNINPKNIVELEDYARGVVEGTENLHNSSCFIKIKNALLNFYQQHDNYVFHTIVKEIREQLQNTSFNGHVSLVGKNLTERNVWEIVYDINKNFSSKCVTNLNLGDNLPTKISILQPFLTLPYIRTIQYQGVTSSVIEFQNFLK